MRKSATIALAALAVVGMSMRPVTASASSEKENGSLSSTGVDDDASGGVKLVVKNRSDGKFEIKGKKLDADATYDVLVDGVLVGQFTTTGGGNGRLRFRSRPHSNDALLGFDPRGALVVVRNAAGADVLAVQLTDSGAPTGDDIICCIPDDSGPECEDRTPAECAVAGGVNAGTGTCALDSCAAVPPPSSNATVLVRCEQRANRSKISVDGSGLAVGSYQARAASGANSATAPAHPTVGDEVQFDFDSDAGDIAAGDTAIAAGFLVGTPPQAIARILDSTGTVVAEASAVCEDR